MANHTGKWIIENGIATFIMYGGSPLLIDADCLPLVKDYTICAHKTKSGSVNAIAQIRGADRKRRCMSLGALLLGFPKGFVHHKNLNALDNRLSNLEVTSKRNTEIKPRQAKDGVVSVVTKNGTILFDESDIPLMSDYTIHVGVRKGGRYLSAVISPRGRAESRRKFIMGRVLLGAKPGQMVDHINHNPLDNRRCNIRLCTPSQNAQNTSCTKAGVSGYKGVSKGTPVKGKERWNVGIQFNGIKIYLGSFKNIECAAMAYDAAARRYHKEFACLNFPNRPPTRA
jgi:hypothetical protein